MQNGRPAVAPLPPCPESVFGQKERRKWNERRGRKEEREGEKMGYKSGGSGKRNCTSDLNGI